MIVELPTGAPRLSLRRVSHGRASDVVGHLLAANDDWYVLLPEDRGPVWVPRGEAEAVRRVPERTILDTSRPAELERALDAALGGARRARLGGWRVSDAQVVAIGDPGLPLAEAVVVAEDWLNGPATLRRVEGEEALAPTGLGFTVVGARTVLSAPPSVPPFPGAVVLTRGSALEVPSADLAALEEAGRAGYAERYRAVLLGRA